MNEETMEKEKKKSKWQQLTEGWKGYVVYAALGVFFAFLLNQSLAYALSTDLPVVAVVSGSMDHGVNENGAPCGKIVSNYQENFDNWWELCKDFYLNIGISKEQFQNFSYSNGFKKGDMPIVESSSTYKPGDIVVFSIPNQNIPIIHRIVKINPDGSFQTKGDHNALQNPYEYDIKPSQIHGKVVYIIPKLGYFKVFISNIFGGV